MQKVSYSVLTILILVPFKISMCTNLGCNW
jgi:hypothetical protein